jgi:hypothetical protein
MNRFNVDRKETQLGSQRRRTLSTRTGRWTDKVFVIPSAVAGVIAKMNESFFGPSQSPKIETAPSRRRHRGFYVWNPAVGPDGKPYALGGVVRLIDEIDPATGEVKIPRKQDLT